MFVLSVNMYSAGSSGVRSGNPTIVAKGIGGSVPVDQLVWRDPCGP